MQVIVVVAAVANHFGAFKVLSLQLDNFTLLYRDNLVFVIAL